MTLLLSCSTWVNSSSRLDGRQTWFGSSLTSIGLVTLSKRRSLSYDRPWASARQVPLPLAVVQATPIPKAWGDTHLVALRAWVRSDSGVHVLNLEQNLSKIQEMEHSYLWIRIRTLQFCMNLTLNLSQNLSIGVVFRSRVLFETPRSKNWRVNWWSFMLELEAFGQLGIARSPVGSHWPPAAGCRC